MSSDERKSVCITTTGCVECVLDANLIEHYFQKSIFLKFLMIIEPLVS